MTIRYNIFIFIGRVLFVAFLATILITMLVLIFRAGKFDEVFPVIFFFVMFPFFITSLVGSLYRETYHLTIDKRKLILTRPVMGAEKIIEFNSIKGFSTSEIKFGARMGTSLFRSNSIIVYSKEFGPFELIGFNYWSFDKIESKFRELGLAYLGHEDYKAGLFFRKYSF